MKKYKNPAPTVDVIIEAKGEDGKEGIVLIKRKNPPFGWALPGGFVDYGESLEEAAVREAQEETSLEVCRLFQLHTYSDPSRDPRFHTISTVYIACGRGVLEARDDASEAKVFPRSALPSSLAFDHGRILKDYLAARRNRKVRCRRG